VLVDVVAVLVMPVAVMHVVEVVPVLDSVAAVAVRVRTLVLRMDLALFVLLATVEMVHVVVVLNCCAPVIGQVLMVQFLGVRVHESSFGWGFQLAPGVAATASSPPAVALMTWLCDYMLTLQLNREDEMTTPTVYEWAGGA
jgi:hypothetical protein